MEHKLINTEHYLLVVSDDEIKEDCIALHLGVLGEQEVVTANGKCKLDKKIIAHLPLNNSPILKGVDLLPQFEQKDDVEKLVRQYYDLDKELNNPSSFKAGYNKAKEKFKYTEDDMSNLWQFIVDGAKQILLTGETNVGSFNEYIQSLSQLKMPTHFECEWTPIIPYEYTNEEHLKVEPKTTTNSQGQTVWVGEYIY